jgi:hypothetical protein
MDKKANCFSFVLDLKMSVDDKILSSDINSFFQSITTPISHPYHTSICGSLLYSSPTNSPSDIFSLLRHGNFDAFRRSLDVYHHEIIRMRNDHGQVNRSVYHNKKKTNSFFF